MVHPVFGGTYVPHATPIGVTAISRVVERSDTPGQTD